jgi:hypothetical protein
MVVYTIILHSGLTVRLGKQTDSWSMIQFCKKLLSSDASMERCSVPVIFKWPPYFHFLPEFGKSHVFHNNKNSIYDKAQKWHP